MCFILNHYNFEYLQGFFLKVFNIIIFWQKKSKWDHKASRFETEARD